MRTSMARISIRIFCIEDAPVETRSVRVSSILLGLALLPAVLQAQDHSPNPMNLGGGGTQGSVTTGYRFSDVNGYRPKFLQLFDLNSGFRLLDFKVFGKAREGQSLFADDYSLS